MFNVADIAAVGSPVGVVQARDDDYDENARITYALWDAEAVWQVNEATGELVTVGSLVEYPDTDVVIGAFDHGVPARHTNLTVTVQIEAFVRADGPSALTVQWERSFPLTPDVLRYEVRIRQPAVCDPVYGLNDACDTTVYIMYESDDATVLRLSGFLPATLYEVELSVLYSANQPNRQIPWRQIRTLEAGEHES